MKLGNFGYRGCSESEVHGRDLDSGENHEQRKGLVLVFFFFWREERKKENKKDEWEANLDRSMQKAHRKTMTLFKKINKIKTMTGMECGTHFKCVQKEPKTSQA